MLPVNSMKAICIHSERLTEEEFDDLIIMQSTGLFDKNGKEIFEGDIVNVYCCDDVVEEIVWSQSDCSWILQAEDDYRYLANISQDTAEIIGNIYENPELLNK